MLRGWIKKLGFTAVCFLIFAAAGCWFLGSQVVRGHASDVALVGPPTEEVRLRARDGIEIAGTYWPGSPDSPAVLLLHGVGASRDQTNPNVAWLASQGYAVLTIDLRGHGRSTIADHSYGLDEGLDARAAFDWLKARQHNAKVAVIGISLGGAAALIGRDGAVPADALVIQAVFPDIRRAIRNRLGAIAEPLLSLQSLPRYGVWPSRIAPVTAIASFRAPVFVIGGGADPFTPPDETRELYDAAPGRKALWIVPGLDHGQMSALGGAEWRGRVGDFLATTIGQP